MTLILNNGEIAGLLDMADVVATLETAYRELGQGYGANRHRSDLVGPGGNDNSLYVFKSMDGLIPKFGVAATRINSDFHRFYEVDGKLRRTKIPAAPGGESGRGRYVGLVLLFSTETTEPLCILPDGMMQPMRVGATSALDVKYLARTETPVVALIGAGHQALGQALGVTAVRDVKERRERHGINAPVLCDGPSMAGDSVDVVHVLKQRVVPPRGPAVLRADRLPGAGDAVEAGRVGRMRRKGRRAGLSPFEALARARVRSEQHRLRAHFGCELVGQSALSRNSNTDFLFE